ncbi:MAG: serine hydrolase [Planctomycetota bacterium]|nr:serine hydrolase [Planctomycetota bacterium]
MRNLNLLACRVVLITVAVSSTTIAQEKQLDVLAGRLKPLVEAHDGEVSILVRHLNSGTQFAVYDERVMPTASLIKVAVLVAAYREADAGRLDLATKVELKEADKVPGSGVLTKHFSDGATLSLRDLIRAMIVWSDNTATNLVIDQIGLERIAETMDELGLKETRIHSLVFRGKTTIDPVKSEQFGLGRTTAAEMSRLLERIYNRTAASAASCDAMLDHLRACDSSDRLATHFPDGTVFAHKTGAVDSVRTDAGILETDAGPVIICVLTAKNKDQSWKSTNAANVLLGKIGQEVLRTFSKPWPTASGGSRDELKPGDFGELVEVLQRTLNAKNKPSPELSIDGDFGPATQSAVKKFQESQKFEPTGIADAKVWKALSPLHFQSEPVPDADEINSQKLPFLPPDSDDGPPFVTSDAWAAVDAKTGELIDGSSADLVLPMASTTKIMTAWLVLRIAEKNEEVLDEVLTFSHRADHTKGSTSAIREGESLSVREMLYGLLLPSGNDASVALAEHFGERAAGLFSTEDEPDSDDPLTLFVAAMNQEAERLRLTKTSYKNPHGLDASGHQTTASDLARLAATALGNEKCRDVVDTRVYGCRVSGPGGYARNVVWKNTNQLLGTSGYSGVKTGTTSRAGACLVSLSDRDEKQTVLAVLGSAASEARYADSRNLHRWLRRVRGGAVARSAAK